MKRWRLTALFILCFLVIHAAPLAALEVKALDPYTGLEWTFETTEGFQNLTNIIMAKEGGSLTSTTEALSFAGILFHSNLQSYTNRRSYVKCALNLGFTEKPQFFWSDSANIWLDDNFNDSVRCIEFDAQFLLPVSFIERFELRPFVGYSFIDYTYEYEGISSSQNRFSTLVVGIQHNTRVFFRWLQLNAFVSYSPLLYSNFEHTFFRYLYYGGELITTAHPVGFTFFMSFRKAFQKNRYYFNSAKHGENMIFDMSELGMSFHVAL